MSTPVGTLELIRRLTEAEELGEDQTMQLADHLNEDEGARHSWPGNMLFDFLTNVYEDGSMRDYELAALARIIEGVLIQADGMADEAAESEPDLEEAADDAFVLPDLVYLDDLRLNGMPGMPDVFFSHMQCDCLDWQTTRRKLPANSPGRVCRHLGKHLFDNLDALPQAPHLADLVRCTGASQRGLPAQPAWQLVPIGDETLIVAWGAGRTCGVFAPDRDQLKLFTFDLRERMWSNNRPQQHANEDLKAFLEQVVDASGSVAAV